MAIQAWLTNIARGSGSANHVIDERRGDPGHQVDDRVAGNPYARKRRLALTELVGAYRSETDDLLVELEAAQGVGHPQHHVVQLGLHRFSCGEGGIRTLGTVALTHDFEGMRASATRSPLPGHGALCRSSARRAWRREWDSWGCPHRSE